MRTGKKYPNVAGSLGRPQERETFHNRHMPDAILLQTPASHAVAVHDAVETGLLFEPADGLSSSLLNGLSSDPSSDLSTGKLQQMLRDSERMFSNAIVFGFKAHFYKAAWLYNVEEHKLHHLAGQTFRQYIETRGLHIRSAQRLLKIADCMAEVVRNHRGAEKAPTFLTQKDINEAFEPFFQSNQDITLRGLATASANYDTFTAYLSGDESIEDEQPRKLLSARKTETPEQRERLEREEKIRADVTTDMTVYHRAEAARHGYAWNETNGVYENADGTSLADVQLSEFTTSVDALRLWTSLDSILSRSLSEVERAVKTHIGSFVTFREHQGTDTFHDTVNEHFKQAMRLNKRIEERISNALAGMGD